VTERLTTASEADAEVSSASEVGGLRSRMGSAGPAVVTVVLLLVAAMAAYLRSGSVPIVSQAVLTGLVTGGVYSLIAMGLTLIFGVLDIVNFAHGSFIAVALFITYVVVHNTGLNPYVALPVAILALFVLGALAQFTVLNPTMGRPLESQLLLTLGISLLLINALLLVFGGDPLSVAFPGDHGVNVGGAVANQSRIIAFVGALLLAGGLYLLLARTSLGRAIRAVAASRQGAGLVGIDVRRIYVITFGLGTACAGAAGMLIAPFTTIAPNAGDQFNILAFVVVVMGGLGNVLGALVSGIIVGLVEQLGGVILTGQSPLFGVFLVFILILFVRPQGIFGTRT